VVLAVGESRSQIGLGKSNMNIGLSPEIALKEIGWYLWEQSCP
jgi:hypothetical protein